MITLTRLEVALQDTHVKMAQILFMLPMGLTTHKDIPCGTSLGLMCMLFSQFMPKRASEHESQAQRICSTIAESDHTAALTGCTLYVLQL